MNAVEWIQQYEKYLALVKNRAVNTVRSYVADAELLYRFTTARLLSEPRIKTTLPENEQFEWSAFTEEMAVQYIGQLKQATKDTSVARKIYSLRQFFKFLRKKGVTTVDPWAEIELHAVKRKLPETLTIEEMNRLLTRIRQPLPALLGVPNAETFWTIRDKAMLEVLYSAALRVSELVGMNWQDIDFAKREVRVLGKGNKLRVCPLGQHALNAVLEYQPHYERWWDKKPEGPRPVFLSTWDMRINQRTIPRLIHKWCQLANVKRVNPHAFRHSAATHMLENGADIRVVQVLLGHASIATTEIYTHVAIKKVKTVHANTHPRA